MAACALRPTAAGAAADLHAAVGASELAIFRKCGAYALGSRCGSASLVTSDSLPRGAGSRRCAAELESRVCGVALSKARAVR